MNSETTVGRLPGWEPGLPDSLWQGWLVWPLALILAGVVLSFWSALAAGVVITVGFVAILRTSLPLAIGLFVLSAPFPLGLVIHGHHFMISDVMALALAIRVLWDTRAQGARKWWDIFLTREYRGPMILLLVLSVLSLAGALSHSTTVLKILEYVEFFCVLVGVAKWSGLREKAWLVYWYALMAAASLIAIVGLVQFLFALGPQSNQIAQFHVRATGFFGQPNPFGAFTGEAFPLMLGLLTLSPRHISKRWWLIGAIFTALGAVESYSRGAWVADAAAVAVMVLAVWVTRGWKPARRVLSWGVIVPVILFAIVALLGKIDLSHQAFHRLFLHATTASRLSSTLGATLHPTTSYDTQQRLLIWKTALKAIRQHPLFGVGLGGFHFFIQKFPPKGLAGGIPPMAHNLYLEWGADLGVGGIIAALWLEWRWIRMALRAVRQRAQEVNTVWYAAAVGALGTMVAFVVHDWVDFMIDQGVIVPLLLALGVIAALAPHRLRKRGD